MKTDIEIAQEAVKLPIKEVAAAYGITEDDLELYGKYKAKITDELFEEVKERQDAKLVLVTAINPTPAGAFSFLNKYCFNYHFANVNDAKMQHLPRR